MNNNVMEMFSLKGKVALVTGGSGKYGKQIVLALAQAGAKVYNASRNLEKNQEYSAKLKEEGYEVIAETVDQGDEQSILALKDRLVAKEGKVDILVNNSVLRTMTGYHDTAEAFTESMKINATGIFIFTREFAELMAANGGGSIINISSYMGSFGPDDTLYRNVSFTAYTNPDYFFHKAGMNNLTRFAASYYGPKNVRVNALGLGGLFNNQDELFVERYNDRTFLKRMANDTDIMGAIVYLASDASAYLTGVILPIDGGYTAK